MAIIGQAEMRVQVAQDTNRGEAVNFRGQKVSSDDTRNYGHIIGLMNDAAKAGHRYAINLYGLMTNPVWNWQPGDVLFLNGETLSTNPPTKGFLLQMAVAQTKDTVFVDPRTPILLS